MPSRIPRSSPYASARPSRGDDDRERARFYAGTRWRRVRVNFLAFRPLCAHCERVGLVEAATVVHHVLERLDRPDLSYDEGNLEGLCAACHRVEHNRRKMKGR